MTHKNIYSLEQVVDWVILAVLAETLKKDSIFFEKGFLPARYYSSHSQKMERLKIISSKMISEIINIEIDRSIFGSLMLCKVEYSYQNFEFYELDLYKYPIIPFAYSFNEALLNKIIATTKISENFDDRIEDIRSSSKELLNQQCEMEIVRCFQTL